MRGQQPRWTWSQEHAAPPLLCCACRHWLAPSRPSACSLLLYMYFGCTRRSVGFGVRRAPDRFVCPGRRAAVPDSTSLHECSDRDPRSLDAGRAHRPPTAAAPPLPRPGLCCFLVHRSWRIAAQRFWISPAAPAPAAISTTGSVGAVAPRTGPAVSPAAALPGRRHLAPGAAPPPPGAPMEARPV